MPIISPFQLIWQPTCHAQNYPTLLETDPVDHSVCVSHNANVSNHKAHPMVALVLSCPILVLTFSIGRASCRFRSLWLVRGDHRAIWLADACVYRSLMWIMLWCSRCGSGQQQAGPLVGLFVGSEWLQPCDWSAVTHPVLLLVEFVTKIAQLGTSQPGQIFKWTNAKLTFTCIFTYIKPHSKYT